QGGLKTDSKSNLIIRISGDAGTGKTSLALALSAALSPYGTQLFYLSLEEKVDDLRNKLYSLIPEYLTGLSFYNDIAGWFYPLEIPLIEFDNVSERFTHFYKAVDKIQETLNVNNNIPEKAAELLPAVCPMVIVIDSIRPFINEGANLEKFIEKCRALHAIVILTSSKDFHHDIDYMVDVVINLKYIDTETQKEKPERIFQLLKTRHQSSRPGAHVFHLSKNSLYISPQLPSQIDKVNILPRLLPSGKYYNNFFKENTQYTTKLVLWDKSQILLHGYGSSGKAGLALSLLMSPLKRRQEKYADSSDPYILKKRKTLVISMLYSQKYYAGLARKMIKKESAFQNSHLECLCFYSGYLTSEDFINKILTKLDTAILNGEPFTGILLDGLHNASLQFPKLQMDDMVWSTLYSLLAKYYLTIVTTYTNFKIEDGIDRNAGILLKGDKQLLDLIIQSSDYYLSVDKTTKEAAGKYRVTLNSAIRHRMKIPGEFFIWDREGMSLTAQDDTQLAFDFKESAQEEFFTEDDD
ncbi:MAG: hypothetical protein LBJ23_11495, partial [Tannerella sp.]|nr:hypothetical protein [Tannerella sp.]